MVTYAADVEEMEAVFRALSDPTRRLLLDRLFQRDGQTLGELTEATALSRFGVMKHLAVLEEAGLVVSRRAGREKLHYLNPVPIRLIADRWISKYAAPLAGALAALKLDLEGPVSAPPAHVYEVYIRTTPEKLWQAITDPAMTQQFFYHTRVASDWQQGSTVRWTNPEGNEIVVGTVLEIEPPKRLVHDWRFSGPEFAAETPSRVTWQIEPQGGVCKLTLTHEFEAVTPSYNGVRTGWNPVLSGLKTLLETGEPLEIGG